MITETSNVMEKFQPRKYLQKEWTAPFFLKQKLVFDLNHPPLELQNKDTRQNLRKC